MPNLNIVKQVSFVLCLLSSLSAIAQYEKPIETDPNVRVGRLANGFTYYVRKNSLPANRAVLYLATKVGSVLENDNQQGLAHFIEHMGFDGTTHYPKNELINYLQKAGVRFGADLNAYTGFDETVYQLPIPTDDPSILTNGIQIIRDWAQEAVLNPEDIDKERGVVLEEKRFRSGRTARINQMVFPLLFNSYRYGKRLPIGTEEVLTTFKPETIKQFYHDWYRPDLEAIIAVGDFDVDEMVKTIKAKFSDLKNPENEKQRPNYSIPLLDDHQFAAITDKEQSATYAEILLKHRSTPLITEANYCDNIIQSIFNILIQNRYRDLKNAGNTEIINDGASIKNYPGGINVYNANVTTNPQNLEYGVKAIWREAVRAAKFGFTQAEFTKAYNIFYSAKFYANEQHEKITSQTYVTRYLNNFLRGDAIPDEFQELQLTKYFLPKITFYNVNQFCNQFISSSNRDVVIIAPEKDKDKLPDMQTVEGWLDAVLKENISANRANDETKSPESLLAKKPSKSKILSQKTVEAVGVTEIVLANGLKVILKPTDFSTNDIRFTGFAVGGSDVYGIADRISAISAATIVRAGGLGELNAVQLKQYIGNRAISVAPFIDRYLQGIAGGCAIPNLEMALQLTNQYFTSPRKDSTAYAAFLDKLKTAVNNRSNTARDSIVGANNLGKVNYDRAYEIFKERFANAADFTFVFVGNFEVKPIIPLLERYLGSLPVNPPPADKAAKAVAPVTHRSRTTYSGYEPKANVTIQYYGDYAYNKENNEQFKALTEVLKIKLTERLRQQESGIYSTNISDNLYTVPAGRFSLSINFVCAPDNVEKLTNAALDEINKIKTTGPETINVEKYKATNDRLMETQVKSNAFWLGYLYQQYLNKGDVTDVLKYHEMEEAVTAESLKTLTNTYLTPANYERRVVLPLSMKK